MAPVPQVHHRLCLDLFGYALYLPQGAGPDGCCALRKRCCGRFQVPLLCLDIFLYRPRVEFQKAVGGRDWQAGIGLHSGALRVHHLDWTRNIMDILPWRPSTDNQRLKGGSDMAEQPKIGEELRKMEAEPLLPVEKKLIAWSLILGVVLLGFLVWISYTFFPAGQ